MTKTARIPLRMPLSLKAKLAAWARRDGISMNLLIVTALTEKVAALEASEALTDRRVRDWLRERSKPRAWVFPG